MTSKIVSEFKQKIESIELIPAGGGCFELKVDDELIYSKLKTNSFPNEDEMIALIAQRVS